jgi:hypothetical protein
MNFIFRGGKAVGRPCLMYFLVNHVRDAIQNELVSELYRDAEIGTLMEEAEDIAQRCWTCLEMRDLLSKALEIVNKDETLICSSRLKSVMISLLP